MSGEPNFRGASLLPAEQADIRRQQEVARSTKLPDIFGAGKLVRGSLTDAEEKAISHGLGRVPKGWWVIAPSGDTDVLNLIQTGSSSNTLTLKNLAATGSVSFQIWVF